MSGASGSTATNSAGSGEIAPHKPRSEHDIALIARRILSAADDASPIAPVTDDAADFDLHDAYRVSAAITQLRAARGERPVGWKIGFTNRTIWDEYDVHAPIWGPMYDTTLAHADPADGPVACPVGELAEPRIEPEIAFRLAAVPHPEMDDAELMRCVNGVAHGIEIVQSVFPGWRFKAADTVAAFALHGCYRCGPLVPVEPDKRRDWITMLGSFEITLYRDGVEIDRGVAANVLGNGPLAALRAFVKGLAKYPAPAELKIGHIVTTGTVTRALPVRPGERWRTELAGLPLQGMEIALS
jgi:2-keto-4-pentenoate hydratase